MGVSPLDAVLAAVTIALALAAALSLWWRGKREWRAFASAMQQQGFRFTTASGQRGWSASGSWRGIPVAIESGIFRFGDSSEARTVFRITSPTHLSRRAIYLTRNVPVAELGAMSELAPPTQLAVVTHRYFARQPADAQAWLPPELWLAIQQLEAVRSIEVVDGALNLVVNQRLGSQADVESCLELLAAIHQRSPPARAFAPLGDGYEPPSWELLVLAPLIVATGIGVGVEAAGSTGWLGFYAALFAVDALLLLAWRIDVYRLNKRRAQRQAPQLQGPYR